MARNTSNILSAVAGLVWVCLLAAPSLHAQQIDLLLKGGHVIDPKNGIDAPMDVAVRDGVILQVTPDIDETGADRVVDVSGLYVVPGLIDVHAHVYVGDEPDTFAGGFSSVSPDDFTFRSGVTTIVDAGTSGWRNFSDFKETVIDQSDTRVLAFLNIVGYGMRGSAFNHDVNDMNPALTASVIEENADIIVGTKIGHFTETDWTPFERAVEAAEAAGVPVIVECHLPEMPLVELLHRMRPGDIFTHAFGDVNDRAAVLDNTGKVKDHVLAARAKGVIFDVGHGGGSFHFSQAVPAMRQGLVPDAFGTDLHRYSMNDGMKNMLNIMSKYLNMGMPVKDVVERATWKPARFLRREDLGHLSEGSVADIAVLGIEKGRFGFVDAGGYKLPGDRKFSAELTIREGEVVWDLNGLAADVWNENQ